MLTFTPHKSLRGCIKPNIYNFWCNYLYNVRLKSAFAWEVPSTWDKDYLFEKLFYHGFVPVVNTEYGALPLEGTLGGMNPFHKPSYARVINRGAGWDIDVTAKIGSECVILSPFDNRMPELNAIIAEYGYELANISTSLNMSVMNSRLAYCFAAKDKQSANTIKDIMDRVYEGQPAVTYMKLLGRPSDHSEGENWNFVELHPESSYLADKMISDRETLLKEFDTIIGLPTVNQKKERMIKDEVDTQNTGNFSIAQHIVDTLNEQFSLCEELFGIKAKVSLSKEVLENGSKDNSTRLDDSAT